MKKKGMKKCAMLMCLGAALLTGAASLKMPVEAADADGMPAVTETEVRKSGEEADLVITTQMEMKEFMENTEAYSGKLVKLGNDIRFDGTVNNYVPHSFYGTFDGCGYTISGINVTNRQYAGLFSLIGEAGVVKNVVIKDCEFGAKVSSSKYYAYAGGIAAECWGSIINCHVQGNTIISGEYVGGIAGSGDYGTGKINSCSSADSVKISGSGVAPVGGIAGKWTGTIVNCCNSAEVTNNATVGGIAGWMSGTIQNCYNIGEIKGSYDDGKGGVVGYSKETGIVANCYCAEDLKLSLVKVQGTVKDNKAYSRSYMQSQEFVNLLNKNRGDHTDWFQWELAAGSVYPQHKRITNLKQCNVAISKGNVTYNGKAQQPGISVVNGKTTLVNGVDYTVTYSNNTDAGTATAVVSGLGMYTGDVNLNFVINRADKAITYTASYNLTYGAKAFSLGAKIKTGDGNLTYSSSNKAVATVDKKGKVTIKGEGTAYITITSKQTKNYNKAEVQSTIRVKPKKQQLSLSRSGSRLKLSWKKDAKATGYQIQYGTNKKFKKCKTVTINKSGKRNYTVKGIKAGKKYYVRVRAFKVTNEKGKKVTLNGSWSAVKTVTR